MADHQSAISKLIAGFVEGIGEVTRGALDDIRHRWEEAWFGKEVTPDAVDRLADGLDWMKETAEDMKTSWDKMCAELARQRGYEPEHSRERDLDQEVDR